MYTIINVFFREILQMMFGLEKIHVSYQNKKSFIRIGNFSQELEIFLTWRTLSPRGTGTPGRRTSGPARCWRRTRHTLQGNNMSLFYILYLLLFLYLLLYNQWIDWCYYNNQSINATASLITRSDADHNNKLWIYKIESWGIY